MAWRERRRGHEMNADAGRTDNADGPMRPCPRPNARSAYESESDSVQQLGLCTTLKFSSGRHDKLAYTPIVHCTNDFQNGGSHLGQRFSAIPHPIVARISPLEPQFIPTIQVFFQNLKICPRLHLRAKSLRRRREFRSNFGIFLGLLPPRGATTPKYGVRYKLGTTP